MNLNVVYEVTVAYDCRPSYRNPRGEWVVVANCKECGCRKSVAWFHTEVDARMWALQKNNPAAFAEFCRKMSGVDGVDPMEWLKESNRSEVLTA